MGFPKMYEIDMEVHPLSSTSDLVNITPSRLIASLNFFDCSIFYSVFFSQSLDFVSFRYF